MLFTLNNIVFSGSKLCFLQDVCSSIHETATYLLSEDATPQIMLSSKGYCI